MMRARAALLACTLAGCTAEILPSQVALRDASGLDVATSSTADAAADAGPATDALVRDEGPREAGPRDAAPGDTDPAAPDADPDLDGDLPAPDATSTVAADASTARG